MVPGASAGGAALFPVPVRGVTSGETVLRSYGAAACRVNPSGRARRVIKHLPGAASSGGRQQAGWPRLSAVVATRRRSGTGSWSTISGAIRSLPRNIGARTRALTAIPGLPRSSARFCVSAGTGRCCCRRGGPRRSARHSDQSPGPVVSTTPPRRAVRAAARLADRMPSDRYADQRPLQRALSMQRTPQRPGERRRIFLGKTAWRYRPHLNVMPTIGGRVRASVYTRGGAALPAGLFARLPFCLLLLQAPNQDGSGAAARARLFSL